jgi:hypothetical protein
MLPLMPARMAIDVPLKPDAMVSATAVSSVVAYEAP